MPVGGLALLKLASRFVCAWNPAMDWHPIQTVLSLLVSRATANIEINIYRKFVDIL